MDEHAGLQGRRMAILYGSETGNSEDMAMELGEMAERLRFCTDVDEMDKFKLVRVGCFCTRRAAAGAVG